MVSTPRCDGLTLAFVVDTALRLGLKLGADAVEQIVEALAGPTRGPAHDAGRVAVVHGHGMDSLSQDGGLLGARAVVRACDAGRGSQSMRAYKRTRVVGGAAAPRDAM